MDGLKQRMGVGHYIIHTQVTREKNKAKIAYAILSSNIFRTWRGDKYFFRLDFYSPKKRFQSVSNLNDLSLMSSSKMKDNLESPIPCPLVFLSAFLSSEVIAISTLCPHPPCLCLGFYYWTIFSFQSTWVFGARLVNLLISIFSLSQSEGKVKRAETHGGEVRVKDSRQTLICQRPEAIWESSGFERLPSFPPVPVILLDAATDWDAHKHPMGAWVILPPTSTMESLKCRGNFSIRCVGW